MRIVIVAQAENMASGIRRQREQKHLAAPVGDEEVL
jgi:hypothetical protein